MGKFQGLLFCTDLDGTLYDSNKQLSKQNLDAIEYFKSEGGLFTFITGRLPMIAEDICQAVKPNAPYGCNNGGGIYDPVSKKYLWQITLPRTALALVREVDKQLDAVGIQLNTGLAIYSNKENSAIAHFRKITGVPNIACSYEDVKEPIFKIVFAHEDAAMIDRVAALLHAHPMAHEFDFIRSELALYEILPKGASKGTALRKLAELLHIPMQNTIAVGDYNNDISMLQAAGRSFAVANAVDEAKAAADYIAPCNDEHAIAAIIRGLDEEKYPICPKNI